MGETKLSTDRPTKLRIDRAVSNSVAAKRT